MEYAAIGIAISSVVAMLMVTLMLFAEVNRDLEAGLPICQSIGGEYVEHKEAFLVSCFDADKKFIDTIGVRR